MPQLLVIHHTPTAATQALGEAVLDGARHPDLEDVEVVLRTALEANADDVGRADALVIGTPANFGYMSGALKHFFDSSFLAMGGALGSDGAGAPASTGAGSGPTLPWGLWVHGRYDTNGAVRSVTSLAQALPWRAAAAPLEVLGEVTETDREAAYELGATLAALALG